MSRLIRKIIKDIEQDYSLDGSSVVNSGGNKIPVSIVDGNIPQTIDPATGDITDTSSPEINHDPLIIPSTDREDAGTGGTVINPDDYTPIQPTPEDYPVFVKRKIIEYIVDYSS